MFAGPIISMINCGIEIWNFIVTNVVLPLLKGNPQSFNSAAYALIERVNVIFVGVGSTLVVLFFLIGFCANSIDIKEELRFEKVLQLFIKLSIAEYFVVNSLTIVEALFGSISGLVNLVAGNAGNIATLSLNSAMKDTIRDSGFGWQLLLIPVAFVFFLALVAASLLIVYQAYSRFLKVLIAAPYGALAFSTLGSGAQSVSNVTPSFIKYTISSLMEAVTMLLALGICSAIVSSNHSGILGLSGIASDSWETVLLWMVESLFLILLTVGTVKGSQNLTQRVLGI